MKQDIFKETPFKSDFAKTVFKQKYPIHPEETWWELCERVVETICPQLTKGERSELKLAMYERKFIPAGRYLYSAGRDFHQVNNCFLFKAEDSREGWADAAHRAISALMTGGGIGFDYSKVRPNGTKIQRTGGLATGPLSLMHVINESGRHIMQGGQRRSAIWAGLAWFHPDVRSFLKLKDRSPREKEIKAENWEFPLPMELTNISVIYDDVFFDLIEEKISNEEARRTIISRYEWATEKNLPVDMGSFAREVWKSNCVQAFSSAEPGFSMNRKNWKESLRNACTEVVSEDDSDKCNLGTVWMNACQNIEEFRRIVNLATKFLICGGIYSDLPTEKIRQVGSKNNRIGLGLGGMAEWLMTRGEKYEVTPEMHEWLTVYRDASDVTARKFSNEIGVAIPVGVRAIAPTGSIGILAETTTGIEPLFCAAYLRTYRGEDGNWKQQYVVDGTTKTLLEKGVAIEDIYDAYDLSLEDRVKFQADVQEYVDMAISSTCNLPMWGSDENGMHNIDKNSETLLKYASKLRGFTCYPDGAISGQPLQPVDLATALENEGLVIEYNEESCVGGVCGS